MEKAWIILPLLSFLLAIVLGIARSYWSYIEVKCGMSHVPVLWRSKLFQISSWIVVAILSIFSAIGFVAFLDLFLPKIFTAFSFGVILIIRWLISGLIGHTIGEKKALAILPTEEEIKLTEDQLRKKFPKLFK